MLTGSIDSLHTLVNGRTVTRLWARGHFTSSRRQPRVLNPSTAIHSFWLSSFPSSPSHRNQSSVPFVHNTLPSSSASGKHLRNHLLRSIEGSKYFQRRQHPHHTILIIPSSPYVPSSPHHPLCLESYQSHTYEDCLLEVVCNKHLLAYTITAASVASISLAATSLHQLDHPSTNHLPPVNQIVHWNCPRP